MTAPAASVAELLESATRRLARVGIESAGPDAELLLRHVLGWDRAHVVSRAREAVPAEGVARFEALVGEREKRRPLQHLTGTQAFWRHEFVVTPDVLIPRPETELIVEEALRRLRDAARPIIVDVGTGSGCIALALAAELPHAEVLATEVSSAALAVARENARRLGLEARVSFHEGDLLAPVSEPEGRFDLVACNPPYVDPSEALAPEVRDHDPAIALFPSGDTLSLYRRLASQARRALKPDGLLIVEIGAGMSARVAVLLSGAGFAVDDVARDLQGIPRTVVARAQRVS